eukprot:CAMPEP_0168596604 /NCGR_PEP_ID=MMETSP0420-20121227/10106_1 /TAXON_ID=498008 /ORGANISM="Pessonella sp." /LENGTH=674 /DNA_ID=CAMNT_0008633173 /DNA_START=701 /DNA_END=2725 /DNA_ORIENTATION=-
MPKPASLQDEEAEAERTTVGDADDVLSTERDFDADLRVFDVRDEPCVCHRRTSLLPPSTGVSESKPHGENQSVNNNNNNNSEAASKSHHAVQANDVVQTAVAAPSANTGGGGGGLAGFGGMVSNWIRDDLTSLLSSSTVSPHRTLSNEEQSDADADTDVVDKTSERMDTNIATTSNSDDETQNNAQHSDDNDDDGDTATSLLPQRCARCSGWRVTHCNRGGVMCPSYPPRLLVPAVLCDDDLLRATAFRAARRGIVMAYRHGASGGVLLRSAQPHIGIGGNRDTADELLLAAARQAAGARPATRAEASAAVRDDNLYVFDLRPLANAIANMAMGGGYEAPLNYNKARVEFLGIANIHATRANLARFAVPLRSKTPDASALMEASAAWVEQLRRLLFAADTAAAHIVNGSCVLLHCSDGWDRTPQVHILTRLLLDASTRTTRGFCALIRTAWLAMGHKSQQRLGLGCVEGDREQSPMLLQLMECVYNVWLQHPYAFEFSPRLLAVLWHGATSLRFASFYGNTAADRVAMQAALWAENRAPRSLWHYLLNGEAEREHGSWRNPFYDAQRRRGGGVIRLDTGAAAVRAWHAFHARGMHCVGDETRLSDSDAFVGRPDAVEEFGAYTKSHDDDSGAVVPVPDSLDTDAIVWNDTPLGFEPDCSMTLVARTTTRRNDDF